MPRKQACHRLVLLLFVLVLPKALAGQACVSCFADQDKGCRGRCSSLQCDSVCNCCGLTPKVAYLDAPNPGVIASENAGGLLVLRVFPHSPAMRAGIRAGDEILAINGKNPSESALRCRTWQGSDEGVTSLTLRRSGKVWSTTADLMPLRSFLDRAWLSATDPIRTVSLRSSTTSRETSYGTYITGLRWEETGLGELVIADILRRSPADRVGLRPGDIIASVDGTSVSSQIGTLLVSASTRRTTLDLLVRQRGKPERILLSSLGISEFLSEFESGDDEPSRSETVAALP